MACRVLNGLAGGKGEAWCRRSTSTPRAPATCMRCKPATTICRVGRKAASWSSPPKSCRRCWIARISTRRSCLATPRRPPCLYGEADFDRSLPTPPAGAVGQEGRRRAAVGAAAARWLHPNARPEGLQRSGPHDDRQFESSLPAKGMNVDQLEPDRAAPSQSADPRCDPKSHQAAGLQQHSPPRQHVVDQHSAVPGRHLARQPSGDRLGLCAFGGGFTFGASIVEVN